MERERGGHLAVFTDVRWATTWRRPVAYPAVAVVATGYNTRTGTWAFDRSIDAMVDGRRGASGVVWVTLRRSSRTSAVSVATGAALLVLPG
jgi:hypothetical protein